ncbi:MAG: hypothetical protein V1733_06955 [bacterium]
MELDDYFKLIDSSIVWKIKDGFFQKYGFLVDVEIRNKNPHTVDTYVFPSQRFELKRKERNSQFEYEYYKEFDVIWRYQINDLIDEENITKFKFGGFGYINKTRKEFSFEIVDPHKLQLKKILELKKKISEEYELKSLNDYQSDYIGKDALGKMIEVCRKSKNIKPLDDFHIGLDIIYTNQDLKYLLADLILLKPNLSDFTEDKINFGEYYVFTYFPTFYH